MVELLIEGKTKIVTPLWKGADIAVVSTKNDITAGDGAKHDTMVGKAELATRTTCNVFELLKKKHVPLAYVGRDGPTTFLTEICDMIPVEVVGRFIADGSYLKRNPCVEKDTRFPEMVVEFFYKTTGQKIGDWKLPCDDPLMRWDEIYDCFNLYLPNKPEGEGYIGHLDLTKAETQKLVEQLDICDELVRVVGDSLNNAWMRLGGKFYDFKIEFGVLPGESIVVADVVDCDSWRVKWNGLQLSKQKYRDGDDLEEVLGVYRLAAALTDQWV